MAKKYGLYLIVLAISSVFHNTFRCVVSDEYDYPGTLKIKFPRNGSKILPEFMFSAQMTVDDHKSFLLNEGAHSIICLQLDSQNHECHGLDMASFSFENVSAGQHILKGFVVDGATGKNITDVSWVNFTVVDKRHNYDPETIEVQLKEYRAITDWYLQQLEISPFPVPSQRRRLCTIGVTHCLLAIGIKTSVLSFAARQALRNSWLLDPVMEGGKLGGVCAWFVVGTPSQITPSIVTEALNFESAVYQDLIIDPVLQVEDSYFHLVEKTKRFIQLAAGTDFMHPPFQVLMMADDDIYLRVAQLVESIEEAHPLQRFYAGQVWEEQLGRTLKPQRDPRHRNYLSNDDWPLDTIPPFAVGPHYLLSKDLAMFVAKNADLLQGLGTLEDVSMGVWMLSLGMVPQHIEPFVNAKDMGCKNWAVSLADLTPEAMMLVHSNVVAGNELCEGFMDAWVRGSRAENAGISPYQMVSAIAPQLIVLSPKNNTILSATEIFSLDVQVERLPDIFLKTAHVCMCVTYVLGDSPAHIDRSFMQSCQHPNSEKLCIRLTDLPADAQLAEFEHLTGHDLKALIVVSLCSHKNCNSAFTLGQVALILTMKQNQ